MDERGAQILVAKENQLKAVYERDLKNWNID